MYAPTVPVSPDPGYCGKLPSGRRVDDQDLAGRVSSATRGEDGMTDEQAAQLEAASVCLRTTASALGECPGGIACLALAKELMTSAERRRLSPPLAALARMTLASREVLRSHAQTTRLPA